MTTAKWIRSIFFTCLLTAVLAVNASPSATLTYTRNNLPQFKKSDQLVDQWAKETGNTVRLRDKLWLTDDELVYIQQILSTHNVEPDILLVDVTWTEILKDYLIDLNRHLIGSPKKRYFEKILENNTDSEGRLVSIPLFTSVGMLFFRQDLLKKYGRTVPKTWEELAQTAAYIVDREKKDNPDLVGFVWQGRAYEGLTCVALEWIDSYRGGSIIDSHGNITVNNPRAIQALETATNWIGTISPSQVLDFTEEEARVVFWEGNAVFMRSWPWIWKSANSDNSPIKGKIGAAQIPKGGDYGKHSGTLGGWSLAVSKFSTYPREAIDLCLFMTSPKIQFERAMSSGEAPTAIAIYQKMELLESLPFLKNMPEWIDQSVSRPSKITGRKYSKVSRKFCQTVHAVLSKSMGAAEALARLETELQMIKNDGWSE